MAYENFQTYVVHFFCSYEWLRLDFIFSQKFKRTQKRFLTLLYANKDRYNAALSSVRVQRMEQRKCENTDGTKQNKRRQEVNAISSGSVKQG
ncbi:hypothetical protein T07_15082 [Trichinella nelsoni]|uniref:Uncharacterized protein n=1 Tax=Trichinella nelsoni TaxID=6336 RepID=A0A0V0RU97_9BILA|nr:hypothetical protein T07_15082 [Trichinella nelsoni]